MLIKNDIYEISEELSNYYVTNMKLVIRNFGPEHEGTYFCTAKNSLGEVDGSIKVYGEANQCNLYVASTLHLLIFSEVFIAMSSNEQSVLMNPSG